MKKAEMKKKAGKSKKNRQDKELEAYCAEYMDFLAKGKT